MVEFRDIQAAAEKIKDFVHKTPLIYSHSFSKMTGSEVYIKAENLQKTGSFKVRGAFNKMVEMKKGKVIAASMGNHAQAVAFAASRLAIEAKIVMPKTAPIVKEEATKSYGAEVICYGENFKEAFDYAISERDRTFIHAFDSLTGIVASHRGNILDVVHERFTGDLPVTKTRVIFMVETRSKKHLEDIISDLRDKGFEPEKCT